MALYGKKSPQPTAARRAEARTPRPGQRGRPTKFGRPSQMVALTLPEEVLSVLRTLHRDPGWAIVQLVERLLADGARRRRSKPPAALLELVYLPGSRALIVVQQQLFARIRGITTIPFADGRGFLAFHHAGGIADLEVAILDEAEAAPAKSVRRRQLMEALDVVRTWRHDPGLVFRPMSILVVDGSRGGERRLLPPLKANDGGPRSR